MTTASYEVHVMRDGRWVTSGVYQDKDEALSDAHGPMRKRTPGIRVVEEIFDPLRERFQSRTIWRDSIGAGPAPVAAAGAASHLRPARVDSRADDTMGELVKTLGLALVAIATILLAGIGGLFWLGLV